ncbi:MAG TPA: hypothetical protein VKM00_04785, partial [Luteimonas sp.]|nr:hypothetical protein [Luteimonas sp.]
PLSGSSLPGQTGATTAPQPDQRAGHSGVRRWSPAEWLAWVAFAIAAVNVFVYTWRAANPLVISDGWFYLGAFIEKASQGLLTPSDFFIKRTALDHSLPLHKLLMLANYRFFGLDFIVDAFVGLLFGIATLLLIRRVLRQSSGPFFKTAPAQLGFVAICAVYLSLNAAGVFEWPLLAMGLCLQFFFFALFASAWRACATGRYVLLALCAAASLVVADGGGIIAVIATILAIGMLAARGWQRPRALLVMGLLAVFAVVYKVAYSMLAPPYADAPIKSGLSAVLAIPHLFQHMVMWIESSLSASIMHPMLTARAFGSRSPMVDAALAIILVIAHLWFWRQAFKGRPSATNHVAVCVMLLFYGFFAGVLLARVPAYGDASFSQPRYILFYQLNIVALLMMAIDAAAEAGLAPSARRKTAALAVASLALIVIQIPLAKMGWTHEVFQRRYVEHVAAQMDALAVNPQQPPANCLPQLPVCRMPENRRRELMTLLEREHLNLFSDAFRRRHDFQAPPP